MRLKRHWPDSLITMGGGTGQNMVTAVAAAQTQIEELFGVLCLACTCAALELARKGRRDHAATAAEDRWARTQLKMGITKESIAKR